ncbi:MAG: sodium-dependent transporter [Spirochaetes bacterium]|nr:sodium-dependent transporter [Spirochaetota bacterium]
MAVGAEKQQWSSRWTFMFAAVSSAVGLGNIWRFPFTAHDNGGGAFIIPYFVAVFLVGVPLMVLEFVYGSKHKGTTPLAFARVGKKYEFIGWIPALLGGGIIFYYGVILVWAMNYAVFAATKAWGTNTAAFFLNDYLQVSGNALRPGSVIWPNLLGLVFLWGVSYFVLSKDLKKGLEKVNKIVLPLMLVSAIALIIRGVTLDNAMLGLNALFTPNFPALADPNVWLAAFGQAMFSLSLCMGIMVTYSSYLKKGSEIVNLSYVVAFADVIFAFLFSVGIFAILGYLAGAQGVAVSDVATGGAGLVFITLPVALNHMGAAGYALGVIFFAMLAVTGWTSFLSLMEAFIAPMGEKFGWVRKKTYKILCGIGFCLSLVYVTGAGQIILGLVDFAISNIGLTSVGVLQALVAAWLARKLPEFQAYGNANTLPYFRLGNLWLFCIRFFTPGVIGITLLMTLFNFFIGTAPGVIAARTTPEVVVFVGGTIFVVLVASLLLSRVKWQVSLENYEKE